MYVHIIMKDGKDKTFRVHKLVAISFVENINNYIIVGHKDNIKNNNIFTNLYWTTTSENTKRAYEDGLAKNDKGFDDSQSINVDVFINGKYVNTYGSIKECSRKLNISESIISRRCNDKQNKKYRKYKEYDFNYAKKENQDIMKLKMLK